MSESRYVYNIYASSEQVVRPECAHLRGIPSRSSTVVYTSAYKMNTRPPGDRSTNVERRSRSPTENPESHSQDASSSSSSSSLQGFFPLTFRFLFPIAVTVSTSLTLHASRSSDSELPANTMCVMLPRFPPMFRPPLVRRVDITAWCLVGDCVCGSPLKR